MKKALFSILVFLWAASPSLAQDFQYQFQDKPYPEANVMVVSHHLRRGDSGEMYLVGRVFNRGLKTAHNVRVVYELRNRHGSSINNAAIETRPSDIPPTNFADFDQRIPMYFDPRDYSVHVQAEWSR